MPIPFLLGGAAVLATVIGASSHKDAKEANEKAERVSRKAQNLYNDAKESLEDAKNEAEKKLLQLGYTKKNALDGSMRQFVQVYDRIKNIQLKESSGLSEISNFSIEQQDIVQIKEMSDIYSSSMQSGAAGAATGAVIALAASGSLPMVTSALSLAGTCLSLGSVGAAASIAGTAVSTALSATPLAAVVAPAVFFTGISASMKADENLEKAEEMLAEAEKAAEEMKISETLCTAIGERSKMFDDLLVKLNGMFTDSTDMLSNVMREKDRSLGDKEIEVGDLSEEELELVAVTRALAGAVKAVIDTPILGKDGKVSGESLEIYNISRKTLPDFSRIVHEMKGMQGINSNSEYESVELQDVLDIEKNEIRRRHEELKKHKLAMKQASESLFVAKNKNKFTVAPKDEYPVDAKTSVMIEKACQKFISDHKEMKSYRGDARKVDGLRNCFDPNVERLMYLIYDSGSSEHGWSGFAMDDCAIYCRNATEEKIDRAYFRRLAKAEYVYLLDGCIYADAELIGICTGTDCEQKQIEEFLKSIISIIKENL